MSARDRILGRVRGAVAAREAVAHPGDFAGERPAGALSDDAVRAFTDGFTAAGGEVVELASRAEARNWMATFATGFDTASVGATVPQDLVPGRAAAPPEEAALGVSRARCAVAETGTVVLDAADGRRTQLLAPTHLVWLEAGDLHGTLRDALRALGSDLPSALGLHSGPSKSADIGQILVRGVHGPGRVVVALIRDGQTGTAPAP